MNDISELLDTLCALSRVSLLEEEREQFAHAFSRILDFVEKVKSLNLPSQKILPLVSKESQHTSEDVPIEFQFPINFRHDYRIGKLFEQ